MVDIHTPKLITKITHKTNAQKSRQNLTQLDDSRATPTPKIHAKSSRGKLMQKRHTENSRQTTPVGNPRAKERAELAPEVHAGSSHRKRMRKNSAEKSHETHRAEICAQKPGDKSTRAVHTQKPHAKFTRKIHAQNSRAKFTR